LEARVVIGRFRVSPTWLFVVLPDFLLGAALERGSSIAQPPSPVGAAEIHYSPDEDLERIDVGLIGAATTQIDMAAYVLTDSAVIEALRKATERGVTVRIWRDANMAAKVGDFDVEAQLGGRPSGLELRAKAPGERLLRGSSSAAHRLGQFQPVERNAAGQ
jgi:phosphatidylserine/phosphatidylglycerophosphate/cardiolipin synthase-like enzyme